MTLSVVKFYREVFKIGCYPAGVWLYTEVSDGVYKKIPRVATRKDGLNWRGYMNDNLAKMKLGNYDYLVIDVDIDVDITKDFPTLRHTFYEATTASYKRHYFVRIPKGEELPRVRIIGWRNGVDLLSTGTLFAGHQCPANKLFGDSISTLSAVEWEVIKSDIRATKSKETKAGKPEGLYYNSALAKLMTSYMEGSKANKPLTKTLHNRLVSSLAREQLDGKVRLSFKRDIPLTYLNFNHIACKLYFNTAIDTTKAEAFLLTLLTKEYSVDIGGDTTSKMLYGQILPSLPTHDAVEDKLKDSSNLKGKLDSIAIQGRTFLTTSVGSREHFLILDSLTYLPIKVEKDSYFVARDFLRRSLKLPSSEFEEFLFNVPQVKVVNDHRIPMFEHDIERGLDIYNVYTPTEYIKRVNESKELPPDNVIRLLVENYFGSYAPLYWAWLAKVVFDSNMPSMVLYLCSKFDDRAGTGKSTLTAGLPQRLLTSAITASMEDITNGWGNLTRDNQLIVLNDINVSDPLWAKAYPAIRGLTTGGLRTAQNIKYGGISQGDHNVAIAMSSNGILKIDPHDRRFAVFLPASIYEGRGLLSRESSLRLNTIFEQTPLSKENIPEIQEVCNYLLWVKNQNTFTAELTERSPRFTKGRYLAVLDRGYTLRLPELIRADDLDEIELMLNFNTPLECSIRSMKQVREILSLGRRLGRGSNSIHLPIEFLADLLRLIDEDKRDNITHLLDVFNLKGLRQSSHSIDFTDYGVGGHYGRLPYVVLPLTN